MEGRFQQNSLGWQLYLLRKRVSEAIEAFFAPARKINRPNWELPEWAARLFFWAVVTALVLWLLWQLYQLLRPYLNQAIALRTPAPTEVAEKPPSLTVHQWLGRSQLLARQGNYREACRSLYLALLQHLDETRQIPQQNSRTDGEYRQLLQTRPEAPLYQVVLDTHEQLCFSQAEVSADTFERCQRASQEVIQP